MRAGRWMAAGAGGGAGEAGLTAEGITREICREVAKLSGEEVVGSRETIASFGVNSLSVAELIAFVMTRFSHHLSALDLMTTATPESIALAIIRGRAEPAALPAADATPDATPAAAADRAVPAPARPAPVRRPSPFASTWADHFGDASPRAVPGEGGAPAPGVPAGRPRPLAGALPGPCQQDLELLQDTIRELAGGRPGGQPVPADQLGAVFLTGATGFVGRFVLSELLRRSDRMLVHCLVRAPDAKQALARYAEFVRGNKIRLE